MTEYQGAVPQGYSEKRFRKTGKTRRKLSKFVEDEVPEALERTGKGFKEVGKGIGRRVGKVFGAIERELTDESRIFTGKLVGKKPKGKVKKIDPVKVLMKQLKRGELRDAPKSLEGYKGNNIFFKEKKDAVNWLFD